MDTISYFQSLVSCLTPATMRRGVSVGPESNLRSLLLPRGQNLHMGATDIDREHVHRQLAFFTASLFEAMTAKQFVPGFHERLGAFVL